MKKSDFNAKYSFASGVNTPGWCQIAAVNRNSAGRSNKLYWINAGYFKTRQNLAT